MWFYIPAGLCVLVFVIWFSRTNIVRQHRAGRGKDLGQLGKYAGGELYNDTSALTRKPD